MKKPFGRFNCIIWGCLISINTLFGVGLSQRTGTIDPRVLTDTTNGESTRFLVVFDQQLSLNTISLEASRSDARVNQMVEGLRTTARTTQSPAWTYLDQNGIEYTSYWIANVIAVQGNRAVVDHLARLPGVTLIEPDREFTVDLEVEETEYTLLSGYLANSAIQPNLSQVHAPEAWARGATGHGTVYAVADTGVYWQHSALINQYRGWSGSSVVHDYNWWDAIHEDINGEGNPCGLSVQYPCDDYGHGTHVAGIGVGDDGGVHQIGMAPEARWIACRNMDSGVGRPSTYIECLQFFVAPTDLNGDNPNPALRADVISNSYSCPSYELCEAHSLQLAVETVRAAGIFMSASAGNTGPECETITVPPALEQSVFTIGAVDSSNIVAGFSSRGPVTVDAEPVMKPNLVAPGVSIISSLSNGSYGYKSGTSMAAPHVAGAVAMLWSAFPSLRRDVAATETLLAATALPLATTEGCGGDSPVSMPNNTYGWGLLDVKAAYFSYWPIQTKYIFPLVYIQY